MKKEKKALVVSKEIVILGNQSKTVVSTPSTIRAAALKALYTDLEKAAGEGAGRPLTERPRITLERFSTGSVRLDFATGGGIPRGMISEFYGTEGGGKTTIALNVLAAAQRTGGLVAFIDAEHSFDEAWAKQNGVDIEKVLFHQPTTGEEALEVVDRMVKSGLLSAIVIDSVAALVPRAELEGEMGEQHVGQQARMMGQALRKLAGAASRNRCALIFINQLRDKVGTQGYGSPETTPGGKALKYWSAVRLDIRRAESIKVRDEQMGHHVKVKVAKNKTGRPYRVVMVPLMYEQGIDRAGEILDTGTECGIFVRSGAHYSYGKERIGQGRDAAVRWLREHADVIAVVSPLIVQFLETGALPTSTTSSQAGLTYLNNAENT